MSHRLLDDTLPDLVDHADRVMLPGPVDAADTCVASMVVLLPSRPRRSTPGLRDVTAGRSLRRSKRKALWPVYTSRGHPELQLLARPLHDRGLRQVGSDRVTPGVQIRRFHACPLTRVVQ